MDENNGSPMEQEDGVFLWDMANSGITINTTSVRCFTNFISSDTPVPHYPFVYWNAQVNFSFIRLRLIGFIHTSYSWTLKKKL